MLYLVYALPTYLILSNLFIFFISILVLFFIYIYVRIVGANVDYLFFH